MMLIKCTGSMHTALGDYALGAFTGKFISPIVSSRQMHYVYSSCVILYQAVMLESGNRVFRTRSSDIFINEAPNKRILAHKKIFVLIDLVLNFLNCTMEDSQ